MPTIVFNDKTSERELLKVVSYRGSMSNVNTVSKSGPPWTDSMGQSPWLGKIRTYEEYQQLRLPRWIDPFKIKPAHDIILDGFNGLGGFETTFRLGLELWLEGHGFLYREALSCNKTSLNARMRASLQYLFEVFNTRPDQSVYITEQVTPMFQELSRDFPNLIGSEYLLDTPLGEKKDGVLCQDIMNLTFDDNVFDFVLSFDVIEHVPDYRKALREIYRTLKPGGVLFFTVPITLTSRVSHVRAKIDEKGELIHLLPEEYHGNPLGPPSLCFTSFGFDLLDDIRQCGFSDCYAELYANIELGYWGEAQPMLVAVK